MTDYRECQHCHVRLIFAVDAHSKKLPPVEYGEDPLGTVAVQHLVTGDWLGRFLAKDEPVTPPDTRHAIHHCEGLERQNRHRRGRTANERPTGGRPRRTQTQPTLI